MKKVKTNVISVRFDDTTLSLIDEAAAIERRTRAQFIELAALDAAGRVTLKEAGTSPDVIELMGILVKNIPTTYPTKEEN